MGKLRIESCVLKKKSAETWQEMEVNEKIVNIFSKFDLDYQVTWMLKYEISSKLQDIRPDRKKSKNFKCWFSDFKKLTVIINKEVLIIYL